MTEQHTAPPRDWLLSSARWLVTLIIALVCVIGIFLAFAAIAVPLAHDRLSAELLERTGSALTWNEIMAAELFFAFVLTMGALAFFWLRHLRRIIDSVGPGEAFTTTNAERLAKMGWLTVGIEALSIPGGAAAYFLTQHFKRSDIDMTISLEGILMALVLFILARVFREGANMRAELEGTV